MGAFRGGVKITGLEAVQAGFRQMPKRFQAAVDRTAKKMAEAFHRQVLREYAQQVDPTPETQAVRRHEGHSPLPALKETGAMVGAIEMNRIASAVYIVTIRDPVQARKAAIHERGRTFVHTLSPKAIAYLMATLREAGLLRAAGVGLGGSATVLITILPRPAWGPAQEWLEKRLKAFLVETWGYATQRLTGFRPIAINRGYGGPMVPLAPRPRMGPPIPLRR